MDARNWESELQEIAPGWTWTRWPKGWGATDGKRYVQPESKSRKHPEILALVQARNAQNS